MTFVKYKLVSILCFLLMIQYSNAQSIGIIPYVSGISSPIDVKNCGDDRLFVADKGGLVRIINADGTLRPIPFLDISSKVHQAPEDGLLGLAFSPNYKTDGKFYVDYIDSVSGVIATIIEEYKVSASDSNLADLTSALTLIKQPQPFDNHVGGNLMFGKDNYLYINFGDGDAETDPNGNGQNVTTFLGKILRIDISNSSTAQPYAIPPSNPFFNVATPGIKKEIWTVGVRNPWRSSVDRLTGDLWIADVGQYAHEEIDFQPANDAGGRNYGWNIMEGSFCFNPPTGCNMAGLTLPLYDYPHTVGDAIIGGYVYRSAQSKALFGTYFFGDWAIKWIDGVKQTNGVLSGSVTQFITNQLPGGGPISFGEDRYGDQYILFSNNGTVYKIQDTSYLRRPKAYFTPVNEGSGVYSLQGLEGRGLTYQWLKNNVPVPGATSPDYSTSISGNYSLVVTNALNFTDTSDLFLVGGVLPLNIISFNAQKTRPTTVKLQWETASEQNVSGYNILRKQKNEATFSVIGYVESKSLNSVSNNKLDYNFIDSFASPNSKIFYRLEIKNIDGATGFSDVRLISPAANGIGLDIYPNPAKGNVQVEISGYDQLALMIIYDLAGRQVGKQILNQQINNIDIKALKGIYFMQTSNMDGSNMMRKKFVVK
jgi:glucose/arabinose dehydrogenase